VVAALGEEGIAAARALAGTGLARGDLEAADTRVSYQQIETVFRNALRLSNDPAIAFRAGQRMHIAAFGMYGYALLASPTRAASIAFAARYGRVLGALTDVAFERDEDRATYTFEPLLSRNPLDDVYRFALEFAFAAYQTVSRDLYGGSFRFTRLRAVYPAPAHARIYRRLFQCPIEFGQPRNELEFDPAWLDHPLVRPDPSTHVMAGAICARFLDDMNRRGGVAADICRVLVEHAGRFPGMEVIATALSIHPRTLRRRLEAEHATYRQIVNDVRMRLAVEYLRHTRMTNEEIAARLGYGDTANFRHAFSRWTGQSPSRFRSAAQVADASSALSQIHRQSGPIAPFSARSRGLAYAH
jgi:AraC-like DNA-binding protein